MVLSRIDIQENKDIRIINMSYLKRKFAKHRKKTEKVGFNRSTL